MRCLLRALEQTKTPYTIMDDFGNWITVHAATKDYHFIDNKVPLLDISEYGLFKDKEFTYRLLKQEIRCPRTKAYVNPQTLQQQYVTFKTIAAIADDVLTTFGVPVVIKRNSGTKGQNVFLVTERSAIAPSFEKIFNPADEYFDPIALAQEAVAIAHEFRVIWLFGKPEIMYEKMTPEGKTESISPMFNPSSYARVIDRGGETWNAISDFLGKSDLLQKLPYAGFDIAQDVSGVWWLLEVNGSPITEKLARDGGEELLVAMYEKMVTHITTLLHA